ncbi:MAG: type II secretion system F family protein [Actinomycetota bacterium]
MDGRRQCRRSTGFAIRLATATVACTALLTAPALAQGEDPDLSELPSGPPETSEENSENPVGLDFSGIVEVDDEGNIIWNVETDTVDADEVVVEPTAIPEAGITGTGNVDGPSSEPVGDEGEGGTFEEAAAGTGNGLLLVLAIVGGVLVLGAAGIFLVRMRRQKKEELDQIEEVIDPLASERLAGEFLEPEYAGAAEAGAYEEGGAAYAQYTEPTYSASNAMAAEPTAPTNKLDQIRMSMADLADKGLQDSGQAHLVAKKLEAAGSKMRPGEWLVMAIAGTLGAFAGGTFLFGVLLGAFIAVLAAGGFWMYLSARQASRQKKFAEDLPETLQLIAGSLRGGTSMIQAIQTVADEADEPTSEEFQRIITETRLGRDLAVSFRDLSDRMGSKDFEWVVTAIEIHREVGGDLAGILDRVSDTIRARNRVRGQVKALSAEGKMSGAILFVLPPGMVGAISLLNREYLNEMLDTTEGQVMLIISGVLLITGGAWLKRLSRFVY